jgi:hypothetical protein
MLQQWIGSALCAARSDQQMKLYPYTLVHMMLLSGKLLVCSDFQAGRPQFEKFGSLSTPLSYALVLQDAMAAAAEQDAAAAANARQRADQLLAEAEVAAAERMLEAAELEFNSAKRQQTILQQELGQVGALGCADGQCLACQRKQCLSVRLSTCVASIFKLH